MALQLDKTRVDVQAEQNGLWYRLYDDLSYERIDGPESISAGQAAVLVASMSSTSYQRAMEKALKPYQGQIQRGKFPTEKLMDIQSKEMARHIWLDWRCIEIDGQPVERSVKLASELLNDPTYRLLRETIIAIARDQEEYLAKVDQANEGKLGTISSGNSDGALND